jgi:hypothetical protein
VRALHRGEILPGARKVRGEAFEFFEMKCRENFESFAPFGGQLQSHDAMVFLIPGSTNEPCCVGPIYQSDHAVVEEQQIVSHFPNGWAARIAVSTYGQQELMLGRGEFGCSRRILAPAFEMSKSSAKGQ